MNKALDVAAQNADFLPRSFDVADLRRDVELLQAMQPIALALTQLQELVDDTLMLVGSEAYAGALTVYQYARSSGQGAALDEALDDMGKRFARKSRTTSPTPNPPSA